MRPSLLLLLILPFSFPASAQQQAPAKRNLVKVNLLNAALGRADFSYERFARRGNTSLSASVTTGTSTFINLEERTHALIGEYRWYPQSKGFHLGPFLRYKTGEYIKHDLFSASLPLVKTEVDVLGLGASAGYQWLPGRRFAVNIFISAGADLMLSKKETYNLADFPDKRTGLPASNAYRLGISAGYRF
jgi:hypothetical protein